MFKFRLHLILFTACVSHATNLEIPELQRRGQVPNTMGIDVEAPTTPIRVIEKSPVHSTASPFHPNGALPTFCITREASRATADTASGAFVRVLPSASAEDGNVAEMSSRQDLAIRREDMIPQHHYRTLQGGYMRQDTPNSEVSTESSQSVIGSLCKCNRRRRRSAMGPTTPIAENSVLCSSSIAELAPPWARAILDRGQTHDAVTPVAVLNAPSVVLSQGNPQPNQRRGTGERDASPTLSEHTIWSEQSKPSRASQASSIPSAPNGLARSCAATRIMTPTPDSSVCSSMHLRGLTPELGREMTASPASRCQADIPEEPCNQIDAVAEELYPRE